MPINKILVTTCITDLLPTKKCEQGYKVDIHWQTKRTCRSHSTEERSKKFLGILNLAKETSMLKEALLANDFSVELSISYVFPINLKRLETN